MFSKFSSNRAIVSRIPKLWHVRTIRSTPAPIIRKASGLSESKKRIARELLELLHRTIISNELQEVNEEEFTLVMGTMKEPKEQTENPQV